MINETSNNMNELSDLPMTTFSMKTRTRFGSWNVRTLLEPSRLAQLCKEVHNYNLLFVGICETRWPGVGENITSDGFTFLYSGKPENLPRSSGVGFLLTKRAKRALITWKPFSDRVISVRFRTRARNLTCIQCYAPTDAAERASKEEFYNILDKAISESNRGDILVVMGDFNAQIGSDNTNLKSTMGTHGLGCKTENGELFLGMCASNNLVVGGSIFPHKRIHKVTWVSPDQRTENQIDHVTISSKWRGSLLDVRNRRGADMATDHHLIVAEIRIKLAAIRYSNNNSNTRPVNVHNLKNTVLASAYSEALSQNLLASHENDLSSWERVKSIFMDPAIDILGYKENLRKEWISDETWRIIEQRKLVKADLNRAKTRGAKLSLQTQHNDLDKLVKRSSRRDKRKWVDDIGKEAQAAAETHRTSDVYRYLRKLTNEHTTAQRPLRKQNGELATSSEEQVNVWADFYSEMLSSNGRSAQISCECESHADDPDISSACPNVNEIINSINSLKTNKSPGVDGISAELLKVDSSTSAKIIHPIIRTFWENESLPDEVIEGIIINIPKKGDLTNPNNWRGITLLCMVNKVIAQIIAKRISARVSPALRQEQAGFRPHKSTIDHINSLRVIVEQSVEWRSPLYMCFIDFEKAFDKLNHSVIWSALRCKNVPLKLISLIKCLYHSASCRIKHGKALSRTVKVEIGARQGCVLSPLLFNIVLDTILKSALQNGKGITWGLQGRLNDLDYADDICLLAHSFSDLASNLRNITTTTDAAGLKINTAKTKTLRVNATSQELFTIGNNQVEDVSQFCYLGSIISKNGGSSEDIDNRVQKARQTFGRLRPIWNTSSLSQRTKLTIFNTNVKSTLLYGCETWNAAPRDMQKIQVFVNQCLRRILRIFWPRVVSNNRLWEQSNQQLMATEIKKRKWRWIGHTLRRSRNDITRNAIDWNPQGSRRRGRPAHTWRRQIDVEVAEMGKTWGEIRALAQDRNMFNQFIEALCSL